MAQIEESDARELALAIAANCKIYHSRVPRRCVDTEPNYKPSLEPSRLSSVAEQAKAPLGAEKLDTIAERGRDAPVRCLHVGPQYSLLTRLCNVGRLR